MCYDKHKYVPDIKGQEQVDRDENFIDDEDDSGSEAERKRKKKEERTPDDGISFKDRRPYLLNNETIPADFQDALHDRDDTRREVIRCIVRSWLHPGSGCFALDSVPSGKRLIVDGHCLTLEDCEELGVKGIRPKTDEDAAKTPLVLGLPLIPEDFLQIEPYPYLTWGAELRNENGEADFGIFYLWKQLCKLDQREYGLDMFSNDTDWMELALVLLARQQACAGPIFWRYAPKPSWVLYTEHNKLSDEQWVDVSGLYQAIDAGAFSDDPPKKKPPPASKKRKQEEENGPNNAKKRARPPPKGPLDEMTKEEREAYEIGLVVMKRQFFEDTENRVLSLVAALFAVGNDVLGGFKGLTHERFVDAMRIYGGYIGTLVKVGDQYSRGIMLDGAAYVRLIKTAYILAKKLKKEWKRKDGSKGAAPMHPEDKTVQQIRDMTERYVPENRFPTDQYIIASAHHLQYFLTLAWQVGEVHKLDEPDPLMYRYHKIDPKLPVSKTNLVREKATYQQDE
jgi:hypothetical protein